MAREYPRFLVTKELGNTKSKGPFLVHTLFPRFILRIEWHGENIFNLHFIEAWDDESKPQVSELIQTCMYDARKWLGANAHLIKPSF